MGTRSASPASLLALLALLVLGGAGATAVVSVPTFWSGTVERLSGQDRYATAVAISKKTFTSTPVPIVYIATGLNFPDALAGGPAAAHAGGPVLLVAPTVIPDVVKTELTRLKPAAIKLLGGTAVVSDAVKSALSAYTTGSVTRLSGPDRYATAAAVVKDAFTGYTGRVFVANGGNFPDALSGGAAAAVEGAPIVLATATDLPASTASAIHKLTPTAFVLLGGTGVLGSGVVNDLASGFPGVPVARWSDKDRFATSAAIATKAFPNGADTVFLATGLNFPDALSGVPAAAKADAPLLLTQAACLPPAAFVALQDLNPTKVVLLGGSSVVAASAPTKICGPAPQPAEMVDCSAFSTHDQAQTWFDYYHPWFGDIAKLDGDGNGQACESLPAALPLAGIIIAVDPGHNGGNASHPAECARLVWTGTGWRACATVGTTTVDGYPEHRFNWLVALRVKARLEALGATVVMTRSSDTGVGPCVDWRGRFGTSMHAQLTVAIHGNGSASSHSGFFVMRPALIAGYTDDIYARSYTLAKAVKSGLLKAGLPLANYYATPSGIRTRSDFATFNLSNIPTVMVELGNMKNASDAARMKSASGRDRYAAGLVSGIRIFLDR